MKKLHFPEFNRLSLRSKLLFPVMGVTLLLLLLNLFMFLGTNHSIRNLDSVYESSIQINALEEATLETEKYFTDYMNTRSDDAFQHFRISMANMKEMTDQIQAEVTGNPASLLDREIFYLSASSYDMFVSQRNELMNISFFVCIADGHPEGSLYPDPAHTVNIVSL